MPIATITTSQKITGLHFIHTGKNFTNSKLEDFSNNFKQINAI